MAHTSQSTAQNGAPTSSASRTEVFPPERLYRLSRWQGSLRKWLRVGWEVESSSAASAEANANPDADANTRTRTHRNPGSRTGINPGPDNANNADLRPVDGDSLDQARRDFAEALQDIDTDTARGLRFQIERARSPRELWHLRSGLYSLVATHHSQSQAQVRLERLNRHFPSRTLRALFNTR